jgi:hypothetical protein
MEDESPIIPTNFLKFATEPDPVMLHADRNLKVERKCWLKSD